MTLREAHAEFTDLKKQIFGTWFFALVDDNDPKQQRYAQLLGLFYPQHRTKGWTNPLQETKGGQK